MLEGDPAPIPKGAEPHPIFGPRLLWPNGCIKGAHPPVFGSRLLWPNGWMDEDATWYTEVDLGPGHIVLDGVGWLVGWGLTALLTQNRSYRACRFVGIFYSKL